jgi:hypothetical protein
MRNALIAAAAGLALLASPAFAAGAKSYQVTGPVLDVSGDVVTVQKGSDKWQINSVGLAPAGLKKGDKVTIEYTTTATKITKK